MKVLLIRVFAACLPGLAGLPLAAASDVLPATVSQELRTAGIPLANVAVVVQEIGAARPAISVNGTLPMNPASTMKLVTTYGGLELLGPAYRWHTDVYLDGPLREGVLEGNLVLKGSGDPKLTLEAFWLLLGDLRARGLKEIRGDLVLDRSQFSTGAHDPAQFDGDGSRPYNVGPDALLLNFKSVRFHFIPETDRGSVRVFAEPRVVEITSAVKLSEGGCGDWRERIKADFQARGAQPAAVFTGAFSAACGERDWHVAMMGPTEYVGHVFRLIWSQLGGSISGTTRDGPAPSQAKPFATQESPTLSEVVRDINKFSNNVMARQLYLSIAADQAGIPGTTDKAQSAIKAWLAAKGLVFPELIIENGAGLSRIDRISAQSMTTLLLAAFRSPVMPELAASLPLVAVDGTMRKRLKNGSIAGQAHIKTGSLADVRAIAGYALDRSGRRYALTMIVNHPNAQRAQPAQDALLNWIYAR